VTADAIIAAAYFSIPVMLWMFLRRRPDIEFGWILWLFAIFIFACGATHVLGIVTLWVPLYGLEGLMKAVTALASILTAFALRPLLPKLVALPSPKQLQAALDKLKAETAEREAAEEMLRQSHKLQAIGQLTAGIAHDFNNLLTVIIGNVERARRLGGDNADLAKPLTNAIAATDRAALLTRQLLAFARKQPLVVAAVDVNLVVADLLTLLERTMGSQVTVEIDLASGPLAVTLDRNQLESALINLALNARDAMPRGGRLVLATDRSESGSVVVCVRDDGSGMSEETRARATEPFFTTKAVGSGTGLGLSQVYGFVAQMGGDLEIDSAPGTGTIVKLLFPVAEMNECPES
jgi:signal transduction histidine kinase